MKKKELKTIHKLILEELLSTNSFIFTDKYRYYVTCIYAMYIKSDSNPWIELALKEVAHEWESRSRDLDNQTSSKHMKR